MARSSDSSKTPKNQAETADETPTDDPIEKPDTAETEDVVAESESVDADGVEDAVVIEEESEPPESEPERVRPAEPPTQTMVVNQRTSPVWLVGGGVVAAAIGYFAAIYAQPPEEVTPDVAAIAELQEAVDAQAGRMDGLASDVAAAASAEQPDIAPLIAELADLKSRMEETVSGLDSRLDGLDARLTELEARPVGPVVPDGSAAMESQMEAFRQQLDEVTADAEARIAEAQDRAAAIEAEAETAAADAERLAAMAALESALNNGTGFSDALSRFPEAPPELTSVATDGVATLATLQSTFPDAARTALSEAQVVPTDASAGERLVSFLKRRTNARSLTPQEGDGTDAILSRAEAALTEGDLQAVLSELSQLPDAAQSAMADWSAKAEARQAALAAADTLGAAMN